MADFNSKEPIALVGIGCRFPGDVNSANELFEFLMNRRSGVVPIPSDRWDNAKYFHPDFKKIGHLHIERAAFLSEVDRFDAAFFGIAPNEARRMDPQQRFILYAS